ncbi:MAG: GNAT family N-acetyltransferase [Anaerolineales bacterium]|nr:GNAT family N-acetyltransferase [Anaerolineales bacterium]
MDKQLSIQVEDNPAKEDTDFLDAGLREYNRKFTSVDDHQPLAVFLRDDQGVIIGGLHGAIYWGWLYIAIFWLHANLRGQGYGRKLLEAAEQAGVERGCHSAHLDTMDFQALPFYEKQGYKVFGQIDDMPIGHTRYFLTKKLV